MLLQDLQRRASARHDERLAVSLAAVVGDGRKIANVVEVSVADQARVQAELRAQIETARERARIDRKALVEHERAGSMVGCLPAVTADDPKLHRYRNPGPTAAWGARPRRK